jgi:hypothetical protein
MGQSRSIRTSAFRRNVAELLGFGRANEIYRGRVRLGDPQLGVVRAWITACDVAWIECDDEAGAVDLEKAMKAEWLPALTKR